MGGRPQLLGAGVGLLFGALVAVVLSTSGGDASPAAVRTAEPAASAQRSAPTTVSRANSDGLRAREADQRAKVGRGQARAARKAAAARRAAAERRLAVDRRVGRRRAAAIRARRAAAARRTAAQRARAARPPRPPRGRSRRRRSRSRSARSCSRSARSPAAAHDAAAHDPAEADDATDPAEVVAADLRRLRLSRLRRPRAPGDPGLPSSSLGGSARSQARLAVLPSRPSP